MESEASQFRQFVFSQARYILELLDFPKQEMNKLISCQKDKILFRMTDLTMDTLRAKIEQTNS